MVTIPPIAKSYEVVVVYMERDWDSLQYEGRGLFVVNIWDLKEMLSFQPFEGDSCM